MNGAVRNKFFITYFCDMDIHFISTTIVFLKIKQSGRNQEGAGLTIGEEVEQVNSCR